MVPKFLFWLTSIKPCLINSKLTVNIEAAELLLYAIALSDVSFDLGRKSKKFVHSREIPNIDSNLFFASSIDKIGKTLGDQSIT